MSETIVALEAMLPVLACSGIAALASALGALPLVGRRQPPGMLIGWAGATAAGMMLGAAYSLTLAGHGNRPATSTVWERDRFVIV